VRYIIRDRAFAYVVERAFKKTAGGLIDAQAENDDFVEHWNVHVWQRHRLDGIVCPVFALPAPLHHGTGASWALPGRDGLLCARPAAAYADTTPSFLDSREHR
jgi:hypothetical protein